MHHCKYRVIVGTDTVHQEVGAMVLRMFKSKYQVCIRCFEYLEGCNVEHATLPGFPTSELT